MLPALWRDGNPDLSAILAALSVTSEALEEDLGLPRNRLSQPLDAATSERLRLFALILTRVAARTRSVRTAHLWYRTRELPGFSGRTARTLAREGRLAAVNAYLDEVDAGGFA